MTNPTRSADKENKLFAVVPPGDHQQAITVAYERHNLLKALVNMRTGWIVSRASTLSSGRRLTLLDPTGTTANGLQSSACYIHVYVGLGVDA
jgi:hypothetical protein